MELADQTQARFAPVRMRPVYVNGCLAWLHRAGETPAGLGAVLVPAAGREARWTYRTVRQLADRLAESGIPALRYEHRGTGDSADPTDWRELMEEWREGVHAMADWLRSETGVPRLGFAGIRFGALLAADVAATRRDVAALALLAPVLSGRAYARELRMTSLGSQEVSDGEALELDGMPLLEPVLEAISRMELKPMPYTPHVLVMDDGNWAQPYVDQLARQGAHVTLSEFAEQERMLRVATSNKVPSGALGEVAAWYREVAQALPAVALAAKPAQPVALHLPACREVPVQFGPGKVLTGVLCEPAAGGHGQAVLITNTGGDPRAGIGRFATRLARRLATRGVASLRIDFAGLGDSQLPGDEDGHLFELERTGDITAAIDELAASGYTRIGGVGVCTGAYHLLYAASADARLQSLTLVNLVTWEWKTGDVLEFATKALGRSTGRYAELIREAETWRRLRRGEVNVHHVGRLLRQRLLAGWRRRAAFALRPLGLNRPSRPQALVAGLLRRGLRLQLVLAFDDPGVPALEAVFGPRGRSLARMAGVSVWIERGLDHTLSRISMQDRLAAVVEAQLEDC